MKIIHKLVLLIAIGFLGGVLISGIGLSRLSSLNDDIHEVMNNTLPSFNVLNTTNIAFLELRLMMRQHVLTKDLSEKGALEAQIKEKEKFINDTFGKYEMLASDATDEAMYRKVKQDIDEYEQQSEKTLSFSRQNQESDAIRELDLLADMAKNVSASLSEGVRYNEQMARATNEQDEKNYESARWILISTTIVTVGLLSIIGWLIYRQVARGLTSAQKTIGRIKDSLDFTLRADVQGNDEISEVLRNFNSLIQHLQNSLREILQHVDQVASTATKLQDSAERVSEGSNTQNASTSHMAASIEEMTVSINHVGDQAQMTSQQSNQVGHKAEDGQEVIAKTVKDIHSIADAVEAAAADIRQLDEKSHEITNVISIISSVADQTNLLALNAAIEAARAGEQGRGFAVVADEVRSLAARTAASTREINEMVTSIQTVSSAAVKRMEDAIARVAQGVQGASAASDTMEEIVRVASESLALVADISNAIREQGAATNSIAQQVENVALMVEENSHAAQQTSEQANQLASISDAMKNVVTAYHL